MTSLPSLPFAGQGEIPTEAAMVQAGRDGAFTGKSDRLAVEEPLEMRLATDAAPSTLSITMRTPGHDFELVAGFLLAEGIVDTRAQILDIAYCVAEDARPEQRFNVVTVVLDGAPGRASVERLVMTSSACGICGTASIEALRLAGHPSFGPGPFFDFGLLASFPDRLRAGQRAFTETGGVHGIALLDATGEVLCLREDVGRHNAVDKVVGWAMLQGLLPLSETALMVSGRISFEIVQKAARAGIPVVAAVSAATSLAVRLAEETGMTLVGFLRGGNCTIYSGRERILP